MWMLKNSLNIIIFQLLIVSATRALWPRAAGFSHACGTRREHNDTITLFTFEFSPRRVFTIHLYDFEVHRWCVYIHVLGKALNIECLRIMRRLLERRVARWKIELLYGAPIPAIKVDLCYLFDVASRSVATTREVALKTALQPGSLVSAIGGSGRSEQLRVIVARASRGHRGEQRDAKSQCNTYVDSRLFGERFGTFCYFNEDARIRGSAWPANSRSNSLSPWHADPKNTESRK